MIRLLLASGHRLGRHGIRLQLEREPDITVIAEASDGPETLALAITLQPNVVVLDATTPRISAVDVVTSLRDRASSCEVLVLSHFVERHLMADVLASGAQGFLVMGDGPEDLIACVRSLAMHRPFVSPLARTRLKLGEGDGHGTSDVDGIRRLTRRERLVVRLIAEGLRTREIANHLGISEKTIESHRSSIFRKLQLDTLADVVRYAIRNSMIDQ